MESRKRHALCPIVLEQDVRLGELIVGHREPFRFDDPDPQLADEFGRRQRVVSTIRVVSSSHREICFI